MNPLDLLRVESWPVRGAAGDYDGLLDLIEKPSAWVLGWVVASRVSP